MDGVHAPSEAPHRLSSVFIPDINLFSASCKYSTLPMMINTMIKILMSEKEQGVLNPSNKGKYWLLTHKCDIQDMVWIMHTNHWATKWAVANPDLQNKGGGGGHPDPAKRGAQATQAPPLMRTHELERFEMAVRMSILKQVKESDWVMHINYCITSNQRVTPLKSVNLNIHQLYKPVPGSKKVRKADQEKLRENGMGVRETRSSGVWKIV